MSSGRHEPIRQCAACRAMRPKKDLVRIVCTQGEAPVLDMKATLPGRGAYLCRSLDCVATARKRGSLARALHHHVPEALYGQLEQEIGGHGDA